MVAAVDSSRMHREALALHETRCVEVEMELEQIDERLPTATVDEADVLLKRRRELVDKSAWLADRTAELSRRAEAEEIYERGVSANQRWLPDAQERLALIDQIDSMADQMLQVLTKLDANSERQLETSGTVRDQLIGANIETQIRSANDMLRVYLIRKLDLLRGHRDHVSGLPPADDKHFGQDASIRSQLVTVPRKELI